MHFVANDHETQLFLWKKHRPRRGQRLSCQSELPVTWRSGVLHAVHFLQPSNIPFYLLSHQMNGTPMLKKEIVKSVKNFHLLHPPNLPYFRFMEPSIPALLFFLFPWVFYPCSDLPWSLTRLTVDFSLIELLSALGFWSNSLLLLLHLSSAFLWEWPYLPDLQMLECPHA